MDVERGRTVKGWRPRRLGEHFPPGLALEDLTPFCILCCFLFSLPLSACLAAHHILPSSLQLLLSPSSFLVAVFSFWVTD